MPIYTKTGDRGTTALFGGTRLAKSAPQIEAYGSVDELEAFVGLVISKIDNKEDKALLTGIQRDLYKIMNQLAGGKRDIGILPDDVKRLEKSIDTIESELPRLTRFILQQGSEVSCRFHIARTVCRRAERAVVAYLKGAKSIDKPDKALIMQYLNRLSDLLFVLARRYNRGQEVST